MWLRAISSSVKPALFGLTIPESVRLEAIEMSENDTERVDIDVMHSEAGGFVAFYVCPTMTFEGRGSDVVNVLIDLVNDMAGHEVHYPKPHEVLGGARLEGDFVDVSESDVDTEIKRSGDSDD